MLCTGLRGIGIRGFAALRHYAVREKMGNPRFRIWSFAVIDDLRARDDLRAKEGANGGR